jgi:hypothetical protein
MEVLEHTNGYGRVVLQMVVTAKRQCCAGKTLYKRVAELVPKHPGRSKKAQAAAQAAKEKEERESRAAAGASGGAKSGKKGKKGRK